MKFLWRKFKRVVLITSLSLIVLVSAAARFIGFWMWLHWLQLLIIFIVGGFVVWVTFADDKYLSESVANFLIIAGALASLLALLGLFAGIAWHII